MKCLICNSESKYFFSKSYTEEPFRSFMEKIGEVKYYRCTNCGFTMSKTHYELDDSIWEKLNFDYHTFAQKAKNDNLSKGAPPYFEQASMLKVLSKNEIIDSMDMIDFAGGYGNLSNILLKYFNLILPIYDPYIKNNDKNIYIPKESLKKYNTVISSALFEHVRSRETLDEINNLVSDAGRMIIHTVIAETIPNDENWFYIKIPVHCSFHTNNSMKILMNQWGYESSIYCPSSKCWVLLKKEANDIVSKINIINREFQYEYLIYKKGFVDYWKGF